MTRDVAYLTTASTTDLDRDLSSNPGSFLNPDNCLLHERVDGARRLAERCATAREKYGVKEAFERLDALGISLWYSTTKLLRDIVPAGGAQGGEADPKPDPEVEWKVAKVRSGALLHFYLFLPPVCTTR